MNRTPELFETLRSEIAHATRAELPAIIGQAAALWAEALARINTPQFLGEPQPDGGGDDGAATDDELLSVKEVAERLGYTSAWVYSHRSKLPAVQMPGRLLRFSKKRLDALIKRRAYG